MKTLRTAIAAILMLATASGALAATIATPSVIHTNGEFWCTATNLNSTSRDITIELVYDSGVVATSKTESVAPGASLAWYARPMAGFMSCRISAASSSKRIRGGLSVHDANGPLVSVVAAQ